MIDFKTFDSLYVGLKVRIVTLDNNNWKLSTCTRGLQELHLRSYHRGSVAIRMKLFEFDIFAYQILIGQNRKKGRPARTVGALQRQPHENANDATVNDSAAADEEANSPTAKRRCRHAKKMLNLFFNFLCFAF